jgi:site-specific DNA-cytosine methylase
MKKHDFISFDLFSGADGLTEGLRNAGFDTKFAFEINEIASKAYSMNHKNTIVITKDICDVDMEVRDQKNYVELNESGSDYLVIWGCEIKKMNLDNLIEKLSAFIGVGSL